LHRWDARDAWLQRATTGQKVIAREQRPDRLPRLIGVDVLRAAAIAVVLGRHWLDSGVAAPASVATHWIASGIFGHGINGVTLFFVISGFLITRTTMAREPDFYALTFRQFYLRRAARILPLLVVTIGLGIVGLEWGAGHSLYGFVFHDPAANFGAWFWLSIATFTFNWARLFLVHVSHGNGWGLHWDVLWSLAVEEQFYLLFPIIVTLVRTPGRLFRVLLILIGVGILSRGAVMLLGFDQNLAFTSSLACLDALSIGVFTALLAGRFALSATTRRLMMVNGLAICAVGYFSANLVVTPTIIALGAALFILGVQHQGAFAAWFWRPVARIGELSYGIYLLHPAVLYLTAPLLRGTDLLVGYVVFLTATVAIADLVYRHLEQPSNAWIRARAIALWGEPQRRSIEPRVLKLP
jgi:peptidoglycan/LPS O-acetylase OafA/YrhL